MDALDYLFLQARERALAIDPQADVPRAPSTGLGGLDGMDPAMLQQLLEARAGAQR